MFVTNFTYHYARLIEILYAIERMELELNHPDIFSERVRAHAQPNREEGVGASLRARRQLTGRDAQLEQIQRLLVTSYGSETRENRGQLTPTLF